MSATLSPAPATIRFPFPKNDRKRIESIDIVRGTVMIIMAIDHIRHFFHREAFLYDPLDLSRTSGFLFFTRWITHFCAPTFVFLAGISAYLYGIKRTKKELAYYLFTRGLWLVIIECVIISLEQTFNPYYPLFNLQVIWATGISMMVLSAMIYLNKQFFLFIAVLLVAGHNLLDNVHVPGTGAGALLWSILHEPGEFKYGYTIIFVQYPVLPWIGLLA